MCNLVQILRSQRKNIQQNIQHNIPFSQQKYMAKEIPRFQKKNIFQSNTTFRKEKKNKHIRIFLFKVRETFLIWSKYFLLIIHLVF